MPNYTKNSPPKRSRPRSVIDHLHARRTRDRDRVAYRYRTDSGWTTRTWGEVGHEVDAIAAALISRGFTPGTTAAIAAPTSYEWICADLGIMSAAGTVTTIYPSSKVADVVHILSDSDSRIVFVESEDQLELVRAASARLSNHIDLVVAFDATAADDWVIPLDDLRAEGEAALREDSGLVADRSDVLTPEDTASILYTSGTTGLPKGVVLTHGGWLYELESLTELNLFTSEDVQVLWLPLAHAFGKLLAMTNLKLGLCTAVDGNVDRLSENLKVMAPTFMCAVPRVLDKVRAKVTTQLESSSAFKRRLAAWAIEIGSRADQSTVCGEEPSPWLRCQLRIADALVLRKIRNAFGGQLRFLISGSAPLDAQVGEWFASIGIPVLEGYGLTESGAASTLSRPGELEWGTVGKPFAGTQVRIADDGEVLIKGPGVMRGYLDNDKATHSAIDDGWLHTGDIGTITQAGNLRITDRKKNVFKTANGKFVAPGPIEARFMALCPYASQLLITGEHRRFVTALVALDPFELESWAEEKHLSYESFEQLAESPEVRELVDGYLRTLNSELNRWEQVKRFSVVPRELSIERGDFTPSLKLRRKAVESSFAVMIEDLYLE